MMTDQVRDKMSDLHHRVIEEARYIVECGAVLQRRWLAERVGVDVRHLDKLVEFLRCQNLFSYRFQRGRDYRTNKGKSDGWMPTEADVREMEIRKLQERVRTRAEFGLIDGREERDETPPGIPPRSAGVFYPEDWTPSRPTPRIAKKFETSHYGNKNGEEYMPKRHRCASGGQS